MVHSMSGHSGKAWREGRKQTLHRDNHQCQDCGSRENIHVHHIKRPEEFNDPDAAHHPSNLVSLCKYCHKSWEGIEARPILLDDRGTNLGPVVKDLSVDHIERLSHRAASRDIYAHYLSGNPNVCRFCYRPDGEYSVAPAEHWRECIRMAVKLGMDELEEPEIPRQRNELGIPIETGDTYWVCEECYGVESSHQPRPINEFIKACWRASEALALQGVVHDEWVLRQTGSDLKEKPNRTHHETGIVIDAVAEAVEAGEGEGRVPWWLRNERY